ncbi:MAG: glycogen/starch/alpha-glucan phosphorylase [Gemmataceae bacterium]|nr:glycogen/starch/alpha-glucan phosphorylase [Gemmataceae bacterium]
MTTLQTASHPLSRTSCDAAAVRKDFLEHLYFGQAKFPAVATRNDQYMALAHTVRDRVIRKAVATFETYYRKAVRTVCYLSAEFLLGPHLENNLCNLDMLEAAQDMAKGLGLKLEDVLAEEEEPGLGNGGLGRLAACFLDSLATLQIPAIGYGIRYEFGIFDQEIRNGWQTEVTDKWLRFGNPWEIHRPEIAMPVGFGGRTQWVTDEAGRKRVVWTPDQLVQGIAYDTAILGFRVNTANLLRLWQAQAVESFDFQAFNTGNYEAAVFEKVKSENITKVLYPNDEPVRGKTLRLQQQYFFVSCSLQDMIRIYLQRNADLSKLNEKFAVQLNDTHPSIGVAELMRLLLDVHGLDWDVAWQTTTKTFAYTNHTLLPEALETWPLDLFGRLLPRHLEIIFEINRRWLETVKHAFPNDPERLARMSLIDERGGKAVRMALLAAVGSHAVNGVSALHSRLLKESVLKDLAAFEPSKFLNVTNGVTPRRFMVLANPPLTKLIAEAIGDGWPSDLERLRELERFADDASFRSQWRDVKRKAKERLSGITLAKVGIAVSSDAMFDVQAKRLHEYKRQHLNVLHIVSRYLDLKKRPKNGEPGQVWIFAGKAAPGYRMAKLVIKLIHSVAEVVHGDPEIGGRMRVVFLPDFNVTNAQPIYPAADLSEQISTAGKEASGTGNMKFALNGALTIGTLDGANVEMRDHVGADNFFLFGLTAEQVGERLARGYRPAVELQRSPALRHSVEAIQEGMFSNGDRTLFQPLLDPLLHHDPFLVLADFASYAEAQKQAREAYADEERWTRMSILNVARMGWFSSDRSIREYCEQIWKVGPIIPELNGELY